MFEFLFPNFTCLVCKCELNNAQNIYLCDKCADGLPINTEPVKLKDKTKKQHFYRAHAPFRYDQPIVNLVLRLKYNAESDVAISIAYYMAAVILRATNGELENTYLVPVPLSKKREKERGYNQALVLAREISKILNLAIIDKVLIRTRATEAQKNMTTKQREENLKNAFDITDKSQIKGKRIILVDDVFTSGATANECARVLMRGKGAKRVDVLTVAAVIQ